MGFTAAGIATNTVTTTQQAPLGFILTVPDGDNGIQEWIYVKVTGSAVDEGDVCMVGADKAKPYEVVITPASTAAQKNVKLIGAAQHAIAQNSYGFLLKRGKGKLQCGAAVTAGAALMTDTGNAAADIGQVITLTDVAAVGNCALGIALVTGANGVASDCLVNFGV